MVKTTTKVDPQCLLLRLQHVNSLGEPRMSTLVFMSLYVKRRMYSSAVKKPIQVIVISDDEEDEAPSSKRKSK